jgi:hypothetical protein
MSLLTSGQPEMTAGRSAELGSRPPLEPVPCIDLRNGDCRQMSPATSCKVSLMIHRGKGLPPREQLPGEKYLLLKLGETESPLPRGVAPLCLRSSQSQIPGDPVELGSFYSGTSRGSSGSARKRQVFDVKSVFSATGARRPWYWITLNELLPANAHIEMMPNVVGRNIS